MLLIYFGAIDRGYVLYIKYFSDYMNDEPIASNYLNIFDRVNDDNR